MKNLSSGTAEGVAYMRFYESQRPAATRICSDELAYPLMAWWARLTARLCQPLPTRFMDWAFEKKGTGVSGYMAVRTRLFDDFVLKGAADGCLQYIIFGAGLDSRAYRFRDQLAGVRIFEVDHPASQGVKKGRVEKLFGTLPDYVSYVPVDFTVDELLSCLVEAGYDPGLPTMFTLEGVVMYLPEAAMRETLGFVVQHAGAGSRVLFDYVYAAALDGRIKSKVIQHMNSLKFVFHEPILSGLEQGAAEGFLLDQGFMRAEDYSPSRLYDLYLKPVVPERRISNVYAIAAGYK